MKKKSDKTPEQLRAEIEELKIRLQEAEDTIHAIREGAVDAVVVSGPRGEQVFTLSGEDVVYRQLVETMQEAGLTTTPEGRILFCNERFAAMLQQPMELVVGHPLDEFVAAFDHRSAVALLVGAQVRPTRKRVVFQASDGSHLPTSVAANILQQAGATRICMVATDLTELEASEQTLEETEAQRQALEESSAALHKSRQAALNLMEEAVAAREQTERLNEQLRQVKDEWENTFNTVPDLMAILDSEFNIVRVNRAMAKRLGKSAEECVGLKCHEAIHGLPGPPDYCPHILTQQDGKEHMAEVHEPRIGGHFIISTTPMFDEKGKMTGVTHVARDITARKTVEEALRESEERYRRLVETAAEGIWQVDRDFNTVYVNGRMAEMLACKPEEVVGRNMRQFMAEEENDDVELRIANCQSGISETYERKLRREDGSVMWALVSATPLRDSDGRVYGSFGMFSDITRRKQAQEQLTKAQESLERERNLLQTIIDTAGEAHLVYLDRDFNFVVVNDAYAKTCGYTPEEMIGKNHFDLYPHEENERIFRQVRDTGKPARFRDKPFTFPDQPERGITYWDWTLIPVRNESGEVGGLVFSLVETTERRKAEEERQRLVDQLADKNKELQSIVYVASHDLRSPLLNVYGFSGQLAEQVETLQRIIQEAEGIDEARHRASEIFEKEIPENLAFIKAGAEKMQMIINGLLTVSRIGTVPLHIETIDMNRLFAKIVKAVSYEAKEKGATIDVRRLPPCKGDPTQINQLFSNIVNNALKYLDPNRKGRIEITGQQQREMSVYSVSDNGLGIAPEHKERIFEIFHRLNPKDGITGEGLGLSIVLRIVDRHAGRIWVDSTPGKGSTFHVELPRA